MVVAPTAAYVVLVYCIVELSVGSKMVHDRPRMAVRSFGIVSLVLDMHIILPRLKTLVTFRAGFTTHVGRHFETLRSSPIDLNTPYLV